MAALNRSSATIRIFWDSLNPDEISRILDCKPTRAHIKGQIRYKSTVYRKGGWLLEATDQEPCHIDLQVAELFTRVKKDDFGVRTTFLHSCFLPLRPLCLFAAPRSSPRF